MSHHTLKFEGPLGIEDAISLGEQLHAVPDDLDITLDLRKARPTSPWAIAALVPAISTLKRTLSRAGRPWLYTLSPRTA